MALQAIFILLLYAARSKLASKNQNKSKQNVRKQGAQKRAKTNPGVVKNNGNLGNYGSQMKSVVKNGLGATLRMYASTVHFGEVYTFPWSKVGARLPLLPIYPTKLVRSVLSGNGILNNTGIGFITCTPGEMATNNVPAVFWSNNASSPPFVHNDHTTYTIGYASASKTPYGYADYFWGQPNSQSMRMVALGIRVRYTGTTLNSAGEVYNAQTNPRVTMNTYGIDDFRKQQSWKTKSFAERDWFGITRMITSKLDCEFLQRDSVSGLWVTADGKLSTNESVNYMGLIMQGTPGVPFEFEVVAHFEVIGPNLESQALTTLDDPD